MSTIKTRWLEYMFQPYVLYFVAAMIPVAGVYCLTPHPTRDQLEQQLRTEQKHNVQTTQQSMQQINCILHNNYSIYDNDNRKHINSENDNKRGTMYNNHTTTQQHPLHVAAKQKYEKYWSQNTTRQQTNNNNNTNNDNNHDVQNNH